MEMQDIKQRLTLSMVLAHYGLKPDKNLRVHCPFHEDKHRACRCITKHIQPIASAAIAKPMAGAWM